MAELWAFDDSETPEAGGSEDWIEDGETDRTPNDVRRSHKSRKQILQQTHPADGDAGMDDRQRQRVDSDEDDIFATMLTEVAQQPARKKQKQAHGSPDVVVLSQEDPRAQLSHGDITQNNDTMPNWSCGDTSILGERTQQSAEHLRLLREQLQQAQQAQLEQEEDDPPDIGSPSQSPVQHTEAEAAEFVPGLSGDVDLQAVVTHPAENIAASDGEGGKLQLKFRTQGHSDVTVRVKVDEPLRAALDKFRQYVSGQGWGEVAKFLSPDGDKLSGQETVENLDLEADDIIEDAHPWSKQNAVISMTNPREQHTAAVVGRRTCHLL